MKLWKLIEKINRVNELRENILLYKTILEKTPPIFKDKEQEENIYKLEKELNELLNLEITTDLIIDPKEFWLLIKKQIEEEQHG